MVNNKFCKCIVGMPCRTSNFAIKAELGREPIFSFICAQNTNKFWQKLNQFRFQHNTEKSI